MKLLRLTLNSLLALNLTFLLPSLQVARIIVVCCDALLQSVLKQPGLHNKILSQKVAVSRKSYGILIHSGLLDTLSFYSAFLFC